MIDRECHPDRPYWLYRYYDRDGTLLYVGIARKPLKRLHSHATQPWFRYVTRVDVGESRIARTAAEAIEREAIKTERPLFNRIHADKKQLLAATDYVRGKGDDTAPFERAQAYRTPARRRTITSAARREPSSNLAEIASLASYIREGIATLATARTATPTDTEEPTP